MPAAVHRPNDPQYQEALAIIQAGQEALAQNPRPDMPGFRIANPRELEQQQKYDAGRKLEAEMRRHRARRETFPQEATEP